MTIRWGTLEEAIAVAGVAVGTAVAIWGWPSWPWPNADGQTWAAWVQAIGSIGAIYGAFKVGSNQARAAERAARDLERDRHNARLNGYAAVIVHLINMAKIAIRGFENESAKLPPDAVHFPGFANAWKSHIRDDLQVAIRAFDAIPVHELGSRQRIEIGFETRMFASQLDSLLEHAVQQMVNPRPGMIIYEKKAMTVALKDLSGVFDDLQQRSVNTFSA